MSFKAAVLTLYPEIFPGPLGISLAGQALKKGIWSLSVRQIRDFATDKHHSVDDKPAGGGAGMIMRADVLAKAIDAELQDNDKRPLIYMSPRGQLLNQQLVQDISSLPGVIITCGRFEGVDERIIAMRSLVEISIGDYLLFGGELAAMVLLEACIRLIPGVIGSLHSNVEESLVNGLLEYPQYTKPRLIEGLAIPDVLLSGNHAHIKEWRDAKSREITQQRRPDLWMKHKTDCQSNPENKPPDTTQT